MDALRRKLFFRATHRGTREMDMLLERFVNTQLALFDEKGLNDLEQLLNMPDPVLAALVMAGGAG